METGKVDITMSEIGLAEESRQLVDFLTSSAGALDDLPFVGVHSVPRQPGDVDAALDGTFRLRGERFELSSPVDWWEEPYRAPGERGFFQNSFVFADPLLTDPRFPEVIGQLAAIFADWLSANPRTGAAHPHRYAWHDHAAAGRLVVTAYVLCEGLRRGALDRGHAETLAAGVLEHAEYLLGDENYAGHHNHGLFSDAALALAARSLAPAPQAATWAEVAERRLDAVLSHTIDGDEAMHLEHSPYYHWIIHSALSRFAAAGIFEGLDLAELTRRMGESGAWLVAPDATLPPIGDTPFGQRPPAAIAAKSKPLSGMRVFPATGYAIVREDDSALIVTAAHHPTAHKHADDGSFCLYEGGRPIVLDSGSPGYEYESPEFHYGTSPAAHATVCVDGFDWTGASPPYGSGLIASAERDGVYALLTRNPGAVPGGGAATRIFVYRPGRFLVTIDDVEADPEHQLVRSVPLAPGLDATVTAPGEVEISHDGHRTARLLDVGVNQTPLDDIGIAFGRRDPELKGFSFPTAENPQPSCDISLAGTAGRPRAFALLLDRDESDRPVIAWSASGETANVRVSGLMSSPTLCVDESSISIRTID
jgi:Heparinase II/III-like protein/Heparinase II/III N-terminus